jgi:hypothetical protein
MNVSGEADQSFPLRCVAEAGDSVFEHRLIHHLNRSSIDRHICVVGESGPIQFVPRNGVVKCIARS